MGTSGAILAEAAEMRNQSPVAQGWNALPFGKGDEDRPSYSVNQGHRLQ